MTPRSAKPVDPLDRQDSRMVGLRLGFDVFTAVDQHLDALFLADTKDLGPGFVDVIRQISKECLEEQKFNFAKPLGSHLPAIKTGFKAVPNKLAPWNAAFSPLIQQMSSSLKTHTAAQCRSGLEQMSSEGWKWFQDFAHRHGGPHAKTRLSEMLKIGPATLDVCIGQKNFTYCHYLEDTNEIKLQVGDVDLGLNLFFDLPFYFLHEYVSHAYAKWDDSRWRFSDAHLLRAAQQFLVEELHKNNRPRLPFLGQHFTSIRGQTDPNRQSDLQKAEDCFAEIHSILRERFISHLLEWATFPASDSEVDERSRVLSGFHGLIKDANALDKAFGTPYLGFETVDRELRRMTADLLKLRKQKK
jgi:hypothetical protein